MTIESLVRRLQTERQAGLFDDLVPAADASNRILNVIVAQQFIQRIQQRHFFFNQLAVFDFEDLVMLTLELMIVGAFSLFIAAFQARAIEGRGI